MDITKTNRYSYVLAKLYLQEQVAGWVGLPTSELENCLKTYGLLLQE